MEIYDYIKKSVYFSEKMDISRLYENFQFQVRFLLMFDNGFVSSHLENAFHQISDENEKK